MNAHEQAALGRGIDATISFAALLLRGGAYALLAAMVGHADFGRALLTGIAAGDLAASAFALALQWRQGAVQSAAELVLLVIVFVCLQSHVAWPAEQADRALLGLAALGVFASRAGRSVLTRLGPDDGPFT